MEEAEDCIRIGIHTEAPWEGVILLIIRGEEVGEEPKEGFLANDDAKETLQILFNLKFVSNYLLIHL